RNSWSAWELRLLGSVMIGDLLRAQQAIVNTNLCDRQRAGRPDRIAGRVVLVGQSEWKWSGGNRGVHRMGCKTDGVGLAVGPNPVLVDRADSVKVVIRVGHEGP